MNQEHIQEQKNKDVLPFKQDPYLLGFVTGRAHAAFLMLTIDDEQLQVYIQRVCTMLKLLPDMVDRFREGYLFGYTYSQIEHPITLLSPYREVCATCQNRTQVTAIHVPTQNEGMSLSFKLCADCIGIFISQLTQMRHQIEEQEREKEKKEEKNGEKKGRREYMKRTTFGNIKTGEHFYLDERGIGFSQEYEKIAEKYIQELFDWTPLCSMTNVRMFPFRTFDDTPDNYMYLDDKQVVFIEEE